MGDDRKKWLIAAGGIAAAELGILLAAGAVLSATQQLHASFGSLVPTLLGDVAALLPSRLTAAFGAILGTLGAGWWQDHLLGPAWSSYTGAGLPALGGVLASPVYTIARRAFRRKPVPGAAAAQPAAGSPPHRVYLPVAASPAPSGRISTSVQESA